MLILSNQKKIPRIISSWFKTLVGMKLYHGSIRVLDPLLNSILLNYVLYKSSVFYPYIGIWNPFLDLGVPDFD